MSDDEKKEDIRWLINTVVSVALIGVLVWQVLTLNSRLDALEVSAQAKAKAARIESEMEWGANRYSALNIGFAPSTDTIKYAYKAGYQEAVADLDHD